MGRAKSIPHFDLGDLEGEEMGKVSLPTPESSKYKCTNGTADKDYLNGTMNIGSEPERAIIRLTSVVPLI